jgi:hypothetical protein
MSVRSPASSAICYDLCVSLQSTVYILLPPEEEAYTRRSQYYPLVAMINMLFFLHLFKIGHLLYVQVMTRP